MCQARYYVPDNVLRCLPFYPPDLLSLLFRFALGSGKLPCTEGLSGLPELWPPIRFGVGGRGRTSEDVRLVRNPFLWCLPH